MAFTMRNQHDQLAAGMQVLTVCVFDGGWNLPLWAAQQQGFFAANGLAVTLEYTAGSRQMVAGFLDGRYPVILLSADNIVAYQQNRAELPVPGEPDAVMFMGGDDGLLSLVTAPGITTMAGLRHAIIGVDAPDTGFALVLYALLEQAGLSRSEVAIAALGSTEERYQALLQGRCQASLLRTPYELMAAEQGCQVLAQTADILPHYQGTVGAVHQHWVDTHQAQLAGFLAAYRAALAWCAQEAEAATTLLQQRIAGLGHQAAVQAYARLMDPRHGLRRDLQIDRIGVTAVEDLRQRYLATAAGQQARLRYLDGCWHRLDLPAVQPSRCPA